MDIQTALTIKCHYCDVVLNDKTGCVQPADASMSFCWDCFTDATSVLEGSTPKMLKAQAEKEADVLKKASLSRTTVQNQHIEQFLRMLSNNIVAVGGIEMTNERLAQMTLVHLLDLAVRNGIEIAATAVGPGWKLVSNGDRTNWEPEPPLICNHYMGRWDLPPVQAPLMPSNYPTVGAYGYGDLLKTPVTQETITVPSVGCGTSGASTVSVQSVASVPSVGSTPTVNTVMTAGPAETVLTQQPQPHDLGYDCRCDLCRSV